MASVGPTLTKIFKAIDTDNNGAATQAELTAAAKGARIDPAYVASSVQKIMDTFGKAEISLDDFQGKAATLLFEHVQNPTKETMLAKAQEGFTKMDADQSGGLNEPELKNALFARLAGKENQEIRANAGAKLGMYLVDKKGGNGDGAISQSEMETLAREIAETLL